MAIASDEVISLNGTWQFKLGDAQWREIRVPSAWEATCDDKLTEGPAVYRRTFRLWRFPSPQPSPTGGGSYWLECDAVSFAATVRMNGQHVGDHMGMWSRWQIDISQFVRAGQNDIEIEVWKPGETRYKLRESLAGFLPDVCNTFGGIWQGIRIRRITNPTLDDVCVQAHISDSTGCVRVTGTVVGSVETRRGVSLRARVRSEKLEKTWPIKIKGNGTFVTALNLPRFESWSPQIPSLQQITLELTDTTGKTLVQTTRTIGLRNIVAQGDATLLNNSPIHLRGVLDWGWDDKKLCPTPSRAQIRAAFRKARALGFNLFKLCLFVPDENTFDVADEEGMLLWLELPMWLPVVTSEFKALALREYDAILQRVHHHPSVAIVSLGCELDNTIHGDFLDDLRAIVRKWLPNVLLCDNSGSSEAYAASTSTHGDFYDYHFYADAHYFRPLVQHFDRRYQMRKPWIYGEFCDADTMRDWSFVSGGGGFSRRSAKPSPPFWTRQPVTMQRDELIWAREHTQRLKDAGIRDGGAALARIGRLQATAFRKYIFEETRRERATGGYVVTGWKDTPITTSGMVDDHDGLKFDPREWRQFNADRVLILDRERRRAWTHGGDRPVKHDPRCWWSDEPIELHVALSNGGEAVSGAHLRWTLTDKDERVVERGSVAVGHVGAGDVAEVATIVLSAMQVSRPTQLCFAATLTAGQSSISTSSTNTWSVWVLPHSSEIPIAKIPGFVDERDLEAVALGEHKFIWLREDAPFTQRMSFWREAIHVFTPRFERLAQLGPLPYADLRFFGVATDAAIDAYALAKLLRHWKPKITTLWRRFDARCMLWHDYVVDVRIGKGNLRLTTLRFSGGLGAQPDSVATNPTGAWLLHRLTG